MRHAVNDFVKTGKLAGWTPEVHLNDEGKAQAEALGKRLADVPIQHLYASPLERTMETAEAIRQHPSESSRLCRIPKSAKFAMVIGKAWKFARSQSRKMWHVVQEYPSRAYFPNGETMRGVQTRAVNEIERLANAHPRDLVVVVSHADIIKMVIAHFLGMHLDNFQRIVVSPASISSLILGYGRPYVGSSTTLPTFRRWNVSEKQRKLMQPLKQRDIRVNHAKY